MGAYPNNFGRKKKDTTATHTPSVFHVSVVSFVVPSTTNVREFVVRWA